jgi:hypothetical protein
LWLTSERHTQAHLESELKIEVARDEQDLEILMEHLQIPPGEVVHRYRALALALARHVVPGFQTQKSRSGRPASAMPNRLVIVALLLAEQRLNGGTRKAAAKRLDAIPKYNSWPPVATKGFYQAYNDAWKSPEIQALKKQHGSAGVLRHILKLATARDTKN